MQVRCFSTETCNGCALSKLMPATKTRIGLAVGQVMADHADELSSIQVERAGNDHKANVLRASAENWLRQVRANTTGDVPVLIGHLDSHDIALGATAIRRAVTGECELVQVENS